MVLGLISKEEEKELDHGWPVVGFFTALSPTHDPGEPTRQDNKQTERCLVAVA